MNRLRQCTSIRDQLQLLLNFFSQNLEETSDGHDVVTSDIMQLSAEKLTNYGVFLLNYGMVRHQDNSSCVLLYVVVMVTGVDVLCW